MESEAVETLLLVPVDDSVVFPNMTVTLAVDVGDEDRVLIVPREGEEFASVGTVAEVADRVRLPGGGRAVALAGLHRGVAGAAHTDASGNLRVEVTPHPDDEPVDGQDPRPRARVPRRGRGDPRAARRRRPRGRLPALDLRARAAGRHRRLLARSELRAEGRAAGDPRRDRAAGEVAGHAARAPGRDAGAPAHPRGRAVRRREAAARVLPAQADGLDPQGAGRGRRLGGRGVPHEDRGSRHAGRGARAGREGARPPRAHGRAVGRELDDPHLPRLADRRAVVARSPTRSSTPCTRARCSTPTTPAWRT